MCGPCYARDPPPHQLALRRRGVQGGVATGVHRMALFAVRRRVRVRRPHARVPATGLSVVSDEDDSSGRAISARSARAGGAVRCGCRGSGATAVGPPMPCSRPSCSWAAWTWSRRSALCSRRWSRVRGGVRPAAANVQVPHTTARGWLRRFGSRASELAVVFAALAAELGGALITPTRRPPSLRARRHSWRLAGRLGLPGMARCGPVALRLGRHRREVDRHQHELALSHRRQTAFHASCPMKGLNR